MDRRKLTLPLSREDALSLRAGDAVSLTGPMYTGRDAAHKRLLERIERGEGLPIEIEGETIYYVGPAPASPGHPVGAAGPTTGYRMDFCAPSLIRRGLRAMIGKGLRSEEVVRTMVDCGAVYLGAVGGAAALIARSIVRSEVVAYPDLGTEAIHRFWVQDFPAIVLIDSQGGNLYERGPVAYRMPQD